jgi:hypothetical protein
LDWNFATTTLCKEIYIKNQPLVKTIILVLTISEIEELLNFEILEYNRSEEICYNIEMPDYKLYYHFKIKPKIIFAEFFENSIYYKIYPVKFSEKSKTQCKVGSKRSLQEEDDNTLKSINNLGIKLKKLKAQYHSNLEIGNVEEIDLDKANTISNLNNAENVAEEINDTFKLAKDRNFETLEEELINYKTKKTRKKRKNNSSNGQAKKNRSKIANQNHSKKAFIAETTLDQTPLVRPIGRRAKFPLVDQNDQVAISEPTKITNSNAIGTTNTIQLMLDPDATGKTLAKDTSITTSLKTRDTKKSKKFKQTKFLVET